MDRTLLFSVTKKDFRIDRFRSGGSGGQNQNKRSTGVRIVHKDSGAVGESRTHRTQFANQKEAFRRLLQTKEWKTWHRIRVAEAVGNTAILEEQVDSMMRSEDLLVEVRRNGVWVEAA